MDKNLVALTTIPVMIEVVVADTVHKLMHKFHKHDLAFTIWMKQAAKLQKHSTFLWMHSMNTGSLIKYHPLQLPQMYLNMIHRKYPNVTIETAVMTMYADWMRSIDMYEEIPLELVSHTFSKFIDREEMLNHPHFRNVYNAFIDYLRDDLTKFALSIRKVSCPKCQKQHW